MQPDLLEETCTIWPTTTLCLSSVTKFMYLSAIYLYFFLELFYGLPQLSRYLSLVTKSIHLSNCLPRYIYLSSGLPQVFSFRQPKAIYLLYIYNTYLHIYNYIYIFLSVCVFWPTIPLCLSLVHYPTISLSYRSTFSYI